MKEKALRKIIADNLRVLRAKKRLTQDNLAELASLSQPYLNRIENESVNLSVFVLMKLAEALEVKISNLVE